MNTPYRRKKFRVVPNPAHPGDRMNRDEQDLIVDGYAPSQMIEDLRKYQAELEVQNKALRYSQQEAEGASERFATLFSVYRQNKANISSVTFWGVSDDRSWLNNQPVPGRHDYPLLYKDANTPKSARVQLMNF